jgi:hypothetical protein
MTHVARGSRVWLLLLKGQSMPLQSLLRESLFQIKGLAGGERWTTGRCSLKSTIGGDFFAQPLHTVASKRLK